MSAKVARIKREVRAGIYEIDPAKVAEGMLNHWERVLAEQECEDYPRRRRARVQALRAQDPPTSMRSIALDLGISLGTVHSDLKQAA